MCISPIEVPVRDVHGRILEYRFVPCRKCGQCLKSIRFMWSCRLKAESMLHIDNYFVTLTYNELSLPKYGELPCFNKRHLQLYFKRLRKFFKFRYFAVSEYGDDMFRSHYHILFFLTDSTYSIESIKKLIVNEWKFGFVTIDSISDRRIQYCTSYMLERKNLYFRMLHEIYGSDVPREFEPFMLCSKKPILGYNLLEMFEQSTKGYIPFNNTLIKPTGSFSRKLGFPNGDVRLNEFGLNEYEYNEFKNRFLNSHFGSTEVDFQRFLSSFNRQKFRISNFKHSL